MKKLTKEMLAAAGYSHIESVNGREYAYNPSEVNFFEGNELLKDCYFTAYEVGQDMDDNDEIRFLETVRVCFPYIEDNEDFTRMYDIDHPYIE